MASTMLRACQRACSQMQTSFAPAGCARWMATSVWPTDVPVPAGAQPFDPKGPLSQIDTYVAGLDTEDPIVKVAKQMKDLRSAVEKLEDEARTSTADLPRGVAVKHDGSIDEQFYTDVMKVHPDFVKALKAAKDGDAALLPKPQENKSWETAWQKISPKVEAREKELVQELEELRARERQLEEVEEQLSEITVNEVLEKYPQLAQEIKDEIEAGIWHPTDAGYKIPDTAVAKS